jgi:hypothetical protein
LVEGLHGKTGQPRLLYSIAASIVGFVAASAAFMFLIANAFRLKMV